MANSPEVLNAMICIHELQSTSCANYHSQCEFGQFGRAEEGYLRVKSATCWKTAMAQEVCRATEIIKEE